MNFTENYYVKFLILFGVGKGHSTVTDLSLPTKNSFYIPFLTFKLRIKTHLLTNRKQLPIQQRQLHRLIKKLKNRGLGYRKISKVLNQHNVKTINGKSFYPSLIFGILKKIKVKEEFMNKRVIKEYMDFDIVFVEKV